MKFAKKYKDYGQNLDIVSSYIDTSITALCRATDMTEDEAKNFIMSQPEMDTINETKINFLLRDKRGNRVKKQVPIVDYLMKMGDSTNVITPMFTAFLSKDVKEAPQPKYIKMKMAERKKVKGMAIKAINSKDFIKATILTGVQNAISHGLSPQH